MRHRHAGVGVGGQGNRVTGSDISEAVVARARQEAKARGLDITFFTGDMRRVHEDRDGPFDLVLSADNAVAHLLTDDDILSALDSFHRAVRSGGGALVSMRDYDKIEKGGVQLHPFGVREHAGVTWSVYQVWQWRERSDVYDVVMYFTADDGASELKTHVMRSAFCAISPLRMMTLFEEAGFREVVRINDVYFQPVIVGTK